MKCWQRLPGGQPGVATGRIVLAWLLDYAEILEM